MLTLLVFVVVFAGMIFLHESGHFLAARLFKIPVDEFGFGFPPRLLRFWRAKGKLVLDNQEIVIPSNFDLPFERSVALKKQVHATADLVDDKMVLRTIELVQRETEAQEMPDLLADLHSSQAPIVTPQQRGAIELQGVANEIEPGTEFTINILPLGGFVRPLGENDPDVPGGLAAANPWKRLGVLIAGPLMNLLTAVIIYSIMVAQTGMPIPGQISVAQVEPGSPAAQAGILPNDIIVKVDGQSITDMNTARNTIRAHLNQPIQLVLQRNGKDINITATPLSSRSLQQGALGVALTYPTRPASLVESLTSGVTVTALQAAVILYLPIGVLRGAIAPSDARLIGLKGMYDMFGAAIQQDATTREQQSAVPSSTGNAAASSAAQPTDDTLSLIGFLSMSLGLLNLLPIPALDGGRILFTLPEILIKRRIPPHVENLINGVALLMLILLMVYVNVMDFINPINLP